MTEPARKLITSEEYLAADRIAQHKSEYVDGHVYAMTGGTLDHNTICINVGSELSARLRGRCRVFSSDTRVQMEGAFFYPDVSVRCRSETPVEGRQDLLPDPTLVAEVLSPSTAEFTRRVKLPRYRELESLRECLLVEADRPEVEWWHREEGAEWQVEVVRGLDAVLDLPSVGCSLPLAEIYLDIDFPPPPPALRIGEETAAYEAVPAPERP